MNTKQYKAVSGDDGLKKKYYGKGK